MTLSRERREQVARAFSIALGLATVWGLLAGASLGTAIPPSSTLARASGSPVRMKAAPPAAASPASTVAIQTVTAPREPAKKPRTEKPVVLDAEPQALPMAVVAAPYTLTEQPPLLAPPLAPSLAGLPQITSFGAPDAPPDSYMPPAPEYPETPGGDVLVLGILVNHEGQVVDARILVPSHNALGDISYAMVARTQTLTDIVPPITPGEERWLEVRIYFPTEKPGILP